MARSRQKLEEIVEVARELADKRDLDTLYLDLGRRTLKPKIASRSVRKARPAKPNLGKVFADRHIKRLQKLLCNSRTKSPRSSLDDRDWLIFAAAALSDLTAGTLVTLLAILAKRGIVWLCRYRPS
jgi:hypothetical protein